MSQWTNDLLIRFCTENNVNSLSLSSSVGWSVGLVKSRGRKERQLNSALILILGAGDLMFGSGVVFFLCVGAKVHIQLTFWKRPHPSWWIFTLFFPTVCTFWCCCIFLLHSCGAYFVFSNSISMQKWITTKQKWMYSNRCEQKKRRVELNWMQWIALQ